MAGAAPEGPRTAAPVRAPLPLSVGAEVPAHAPVGRPRHGRTHDNAASPSAEDLTWYGGLAGDRRPDSVPGRCPRARGDTPFRGGAGSPAASVITGPPQIDPALVRAAQQADQIAVAGLIDALAASHVGRMCGPHRAAGWPGHRAGGAGRDLKKPPGLRESATICGWAPAIAAREANRVTRTAVRAVPPRLARQILEGSTMPWTGRA